MYVIQTVVDMVSLGLLRDRQVAEGGHRKGRKISKPLRSEGGEQDDGGVALITSYFFYKGGRQMVELRVNTRTCL